MTPDELKGIQLAVTTSIIACVELIEGKCLEVGFNEHQINERIQCALMAFADTIKECRQIYLK